MEKAVQYLQIFRSSDGALVRPLRSAKATFATVGEEANAGGAVPPGGPLTRLLSVMMYSMLSSHASLCHKIDNFETLGNHLYDIGVCLVTY
jgi:hypothetical protein